MPGVLRLSVFVEKGGHLVGCYMAIYLLLDRDNRRQTAGAQAAGNFKREKAIFAGLAEIDAELLFEAVGNAICAFYIAGGAETNTDLVAAGALETEKIIKCRHTAYLGRRDLKQMGHGIHALIGKIPEFLLYLMQDRDQLAFLVRPLLIVFIYSTISGPNAALQVC